MKRDRNTFFADSNMQGVNYMPGNMGAPYQMSQASQSFYAGPNPNANQMSYQESNYSELDNRLSKIERQINRLDSRITRLENNSTFLDKDNYSNGMYMV